MSNTPTGIEIRRRMARYERSTELLERRAARCANPALAALLRERARARHRTEEQVRALLDPRPAA